MERVHIQGLPKLLGTPYYLRNGLSYTDFKFCMHIHKVNQNKSP